MKTKLTQFKKNYFVLTSILKLVFLIPTSYHKKLSLIPCRILPVLIFMLSVTASFGQSNSCQAKLFVDHDLNVGSSSPEGTYYAMIITNTGTSADTFSLSSLNINSTCSNIDGSSTINNVNLETTFADINLIPINDITLSAGQSINFYSHVIIPVGTAIKKWCCTQVIAESKNCTNYKVTTVLHTYYSGPIEN